MQLDSHSDFTQGWDVEMVKEWLAARNEHGLVDHMRGSDIAIAVDVGIGSGRATVWTCDLTHGYVTINAEYHT